MNPGAVVVVVAVDGEEFSNPPAVVVVVDIWMSSAELYARECWGRG